MLIVVGVVLAALAILASISLHEAGHLVAAKALGMRATQYFVGFGPTLWSFRRGDTEYGLRAIPLGGFVKITGMAAQDADAEDPRAMWRFPVWKRTVVMSAGSITHFLLAVVATWFAAIFIGLPNPAIPTDTAGELKAPAMIEVGTCVKVVLPAQTQQPQCTPGVGTDQAAPAAAAGLETGDIITKVGTTPVANYGQLTDAIRATKPAPTVFEYTRAGQPGQTTVNLIAAQRTPLDDPEGPVREVAVAGVNWHTDLPGSITYGPIGAFGATGGFSWTLVKGTFSALGRIPDKVPALWHSITGSERDPDTPISVVGASRLGGEAIENGVPQLFLMIFISLNIFIGIFNLLPLLPVDGGHIAIAWYERVRSWLYARLRKPDPGRVDYYKLMPITYAVILIGGAFTLLTITADVVNPITIFGR